MKTETYQFGVEQTRDGEYRIVFEGEYITNEPTSHMIARNHDHFCVECGEYKQASSGEYTVIKIRRTLFGVPLGWKRSSIVFECADCLGAELRISKP